MGNIEITADELSANAHIPDEQIKQDIADTIEEIEDLRKCLGAYIILASSSRLGQFKIRTYQFLADAIPRQIAERVEFNTKLSALLDARNKQGRQS